MLRSKTSFVAFLPNGVVKHVAPGQFFEDSDPVAKGRERLFEHVEDASQKRRRRPRRQEPEVEPVGEGEAESDGAW